ncbi:MAG: O-sialoglycoprotein endopeptidase [Firmicutes bacterium]|nr:O-sialoglycoprotein endopeptidase [Bacillota bacterium]
MAASTAPRPAPDSYMPVFKVGEAVGRSVAACLGVPFVALSHQEGHIWAGLWSSGRSQATGVPADLIVLHASGGTTELVRAETLPGGRFQVTRLGGTEDLNAGQFIDRIGVALGLPFPAGPHLETLAATGDPRAVRLPVAVRPGRVSFSGPATAALRALERGVSPADLAAAAQECAAESLARLVGAVAGSASGSAAFLGVGGVLANARVRERIAQELAARGLDAWFAAPAHSVDNAVGVAFAAVQAVRDSERTAGSA